MDILLNIMPMFQETEICHSLLGYCTTKPGAPAGIWPVVRTYDAEEWGGGG